MVYSKTTWANSPATSSPLSAANLNHLETQYDEAVADLVNITGDTMTGNLLIRNSGGASGLELGKVASAETPFLDFHSSGNDIDYDARIIASGGSASVGNGTLNILAAVLQKSGNTIWHSGNDGAGSGLDADVLDGINSSQFARLDAASNFTVAPTIGGGTVWHSGNDGSGSGLDADTVDNLHAASFSLTSHTHSYVRVAQGQYTGDGSTSNSTLLDAPVASVYLSLEIFEQSGTRWYIGTNNNGVGLIPGAGPSNDEVFDTNPYFTWAPGSGIVTIGVNNAGLGANFNGSTYDWTLFYLD